MKLAKKMFACIVAIMLVGSFAIMAFAEEAPKAGFILTVDGEAVVGEEITLTVAIENAEGLESFDIEIAFDKDLVEPVGEAKGVAGSPFAGYAGGAPKDGTTGIVTGSAMSMDAVETNDKTDLAVYTFKVLAAGEIEFTLTVGEFDGVEDYEKTATTTVTAKEEADPKDEDEDKDKDKDKDEDGDKIPTTGDAGLAIASGLVVLAGAAFVVSRKRK